MQCKEIWIAKAPSKYANSSDIKFISVDPTNPSDIINTIYEPFKENELTTVLPFMTDKMAERRADFLSFDGCVQPIDLEFDDCTKELQIERNKLLINEINTPVIQVDSGNKSIHLILFFSKFANNNFEYKKKCKAFVTYLSREYPNYFQEKGGARKELVPDYTLFTGNKYFRQPNGIRDSGELQVAELHNFSDVSYEITNLDDVIGVSTTFFNSNSQSISYVPTIEKRDLRKATLTFIVMGVGQGNRDNECYRAACDLKDCGYKKSEAINMLIDGAGKCVPPFIDEDVIKKVESAWSGDGYFNPVNPHKPFAFIERSSASYCYLLDGNLYFATKDILKETFLSYGEIMPKPFPTVLFKFDPHDDRQLDLGNHSYNLFKPTQYQLMLANGTTYNPKTDFPTITKLIENLIPKNNESDAFLNWVATILQTREKMLTTFVFLGEQGSGKGLLLKYILQPLFGEKQTLQVEDEQLKSSFNGWMKNVSFIAFNEIAHDNRGRNTINSKIKSIVTDPTLIVNEKNIRTYVIDNHVNSIFFSNEKIPLLVERNDRRFNIINTGKALIKTNWFNAPVTIQFLKNEIQYFAQYLWNMNIDISQANTVMDSKAKDTLVSVGLGRYEEFACKLQDADIDWFLDNYEHEYNSISRDELLQIKSGEIAKSFALKVFNGIYGGSPVTKNYFSKQLKLHGIEPNRSKDSQRTRIYKWEK